MMIGMKEHWKNLNNMRVNGDRVKFVKKHRKSVFYIRF